MFPVVGERRPREISRAGMGATRLGSRRAVRFLALLLASGLGGVLSSGPARAALPERIPSGPVAPAVDWPLYSQASAADRIAPIPALTPQTVSRLSLVFSVPLGPGGASNESYPLELDGAIYVTGPADTVFAVDATTGRVVWRFRPSGMHQPPWAPVATRGVALGDGLVFLLTADDRLIALSAATGRVHYAVPVADPAQGYFETMAPLFADGAVIVGSSGGDEGIRGFVAAYDGRTGRRLWEFYTVPSPGVSWVPAAGHHGGGAVWTTPTFSPSSGTVYVPVGNPSPDYFGAVRPGPDLYTDSIVALSAASGRLLWYQQEVPHDLWDYDAASPPLLFPGPGGPAVAEAGKDGYLYAFDAATGDPVFPPVPFVREARRDPSPLGTVVWPGPVGGANYGPSAYDPERHLAFVAGINAGAVLYSERQAQPADPLDFGTAATYLSALRWTGTITAVDMRTGRIAWQDRTASPPIGGVSATTGGVLLFGQEDGRLEAVSASSGRVVWRVQTGTPIGSAPIVYELGGRVYVAVVTGGATAMRHRYPTPARSQLLVYRLGQR